MKEFISLRQAICLLIMFVMGSTVVLGLNADAEQDTWITLIMTLITSIPLYFIYCRIIKLYPQKNIYEIICQIFGNVIGKVIVILLVWFSIYLASLVLRDFTEFVQITAMPETPQITLMICMFFIVAFLLKSGIEVMGRWAYIVFLITISIFIITDILSVGQMDATNLLPVLNHKPEEFAGSILKMISYPFGETVVFLSIADSFKKGISPYKVFIYGISIIGIILFIVLLRNIMVMGQFAEIQLFPSYMLAEIIHIAEFAARIEIIISFSFIFGAATKISVCLLSASKGLVKVFNLKSYRNIVIPVALFGFAISPMIFDNFIGLIEFTDKIYPYYAVPFEILIPFIVWIVAEIKNKINKKTQNKEFTEENNRTDLLERIKEGSNL